MKIIITHDRLKEREKKNFENLLGKFVRNVGMFFHGFYYKIKYYLAHIFIVYKCAT